MLTNLLWSFVVCNFIYTLAAFASDSNDQPPACNENTFSTTLAQTNSAQAQDSLPVEVIPSLNAKPKALSAKDLVALKSSVEREGALDVLITQGLDSVDKVVSDLLSQLRATELNETGIDNALFFASSFSFRSADLGGAQNLLKKQVFKNCHHILWNIAANNDYLESQRLRAAIGVLATLFSFDEATRGSYQSSIRTLRSAMDSVPWESKSIQKQALFTLDAADFVSLSKEHYVIGGISALLTSGEKKKATITKTERMQRALADLIIYYATAVTTLYQDKAGVVAMTWASTLLKALTKPIDDDAAASHDWAKRGPFHLNTLAFFAARNVVTFSDLLSLPAPDEVDGFSDIIP